MKFLKWFGLLSLSIILLFFIIALFLPSSFRIDRSVEIEKSVEVAFQTAYDMKQRAKWDPWIEMDPEALIILDIHPDIIGSGYHWKGDIIGEGKLTIKEFIVNQKIKSEIEFIAPRSATFDVIWTFEPNESKDKIKVSWAFEGTLSYPMERWFGLFMDQSLGSSFEKGLSNFKALVEKSPDLIGRTGDIKEVEFDGLMGLSVRKESSIERIVGSMFTNYISLRSYFKQNNIEISGSPFTYYHSVNNDYSDIVFDFGFTTNTKQAGNHEIKYIEIPAGKTIMASHYGHFKTVKKTHDAIRAYISEHQLKQNGTHWEVYITDPLKEPNQSKWETHVYFPIE